jgi:hypothetical protein
MVKLEMLHGVAKLRCGEWMDDGLWACCDNYDSGIHLA